MRGGGDEGVRDGGDDRGGERSRLPRQLSLCNSNRIIIVQCTSNML